MTAAGDTPVGAAGGEVLVRSTHYFGRDGFSYSEFDRWVQRLPGRIVSVVWGGAVGFVAICEEPAASSTAP